tara:strand:- start:4126 stop:4746 length:621 start_codon:yes stop_codon:yes gene_type:complete
MAICQRRINKEISNFDECNFYQLYNHNIADFFNNIHIIQWKRSDNINGLDFYNKNELILTLTLPSDYPFKPYKIIFSNITEKFQISQIHNTYEKSLVELTKNIKKNNYDDKIISFFLELYIGKKSTIFKSKHDCLCCNSIACGYNWNPSCTINFSLLEYLEIYFLAKYTTPLNNKKMVYIYNTLFNYVFEKLPHEILTKIFKYCID